MNTGSSFAEGYAIGRDNGCCNGNGNGMWGGGWDGLWGIIILAMIFGWGNGGWGGFGGNNGANTFVPYAVGNSYTDATIQRGFDTQTIVGKLDGINQGLCDGFYAVNTSLLNGFHGVDNAVCNLGYQTQQGFNATQVALMQGNNALQAQLAQCCCDNRVGQMQIQNAIDSCCCTTNRTIENGFANTNYNLATQACAIQTQMANNTRDIIDSQRDGTRAILDYLCQEKISDLQAENQALRLSASQSAQNAAIGAMISASEATILRRTGNDCPIPAYVVPNPNCCYGPFGYGYNGYGNNNGCGCNSGCGC